MSVNTPQKAIDTNHGWVRESDERPGHHPGRTGRTMSGTASRQTHTPLTLVIGLAAVVFSGLYFLSDVLELLQGGFSTTQLLITYVAEAAIPLFVIGLYAVQQPHIGRLGLLGAVGYAYTYVFFTGTVLLALVNKSPDWATLADDLGPWVTVHGLFMLVAGSAFGVAVVRARVLPRWTGVLLLAGVILVALASMLPGALQMLCAGVRDLAFAGMGLSLLTHREPARTTPGSAVVQIPARRGRERHDPIRA
jgi:hypothetical protein